MCIEREFLQASLIPNPVVEMLSSGCENGTMLSYFGPDSSEQLSCKVYCTRNGPVDDPYSALAEEQLAQLDSNEGLIDKALRSRTPGPRP